MERGFTASTKKIFRQVFTTGGDKWPETEVFTSTGLKHEELQAVRGMRETLYTLCPVEYKKDWSKNYIIYMIHNFFKFHDLSGHVYIFDNVKLCLTIEAKVYQKKLKSIYIYIYINLDCFTVIWSRRSLRIFILKWCRQL